MILDLCGRNRPAEFLCDKVVFAWTSPAPRVLLVLETLRQSVVTSSARHSVSELPLLALGANMAVGE